MPRHTCGVWSGPLDLRLLLIYWHLLAMVSRAGGYFGAPFKGRRGVNQGDPISPMIFNVVVDAVLQILVSVVIATERLVEPGTEGFIQAIQWLTA